MNSFKGNENTKFKSIITCEFTTPLAFDNIEAHFNRPFEELLTMNNFDDIYSNIQENFIAWVDEFKEKGLLSSFPCINELKVFVYNV